MTAPIDADAPDHVRDVITAPLDRAPRGTDVLRRYRAETARAMAEGSRARSQRTQRL